MNPTKDPLIPTPDEIAEMGEAELEDTYAIVHDYAHALLYGGLTDGEGQSEPPLPRAIDAQTATQRRRVFSLYQAITAIDHAAMLLGVLPRTHLSLIDDLLARVCGAESTAPRPCREEHEAAYEQLIDAEAKSGPNKDDPELSDVPDRELARQAAIAMGRPPEQAENMRKTVASWRGKSDYRRKIALKRREIICMELAEELSSLSPSRGYDRIDETYFQRYFTETRPAVEDAIRGAGILPG